MEMQQTVAGSAAFSGIALHTGAEQSPSSLEQVAVMVAPTAVKVQTWP